MSELFCYRLAADGVHLEADAAEHHIVTRMRSLRAAGFTLRGIAAELNRDGFATRRGTPWQFQYTAAVLRTDAAGSRLSDAA